MFFNRKSIAIESESLSQQTWKRFKRNKLAMVGLIFILFATLLSVLGYSITADKTPYANDQKPELHIKQPGFAVNTLRVTKNEIIEKKNFLNHMLFGSANPCSSIPFYSMRFDKTDIVVEEYTGNSPNHGELSRINLADVLYALDLRSKIVFDSVSNTLSFYELNTTKKITAKIPELQNKILNEQVSYKTYVLGTDLLGRDMLSRLLIGTRISLTVGLISVIISILIGITLGSLAGYYRGKIDTLIMWLINVVWSIPTLLLVIAITLVLGKGVFQVFIAVGLTMWVEVARILRGQVLSIREKEYVEAGRALGFSDGRIIFRHVLPNVMGPVIVMAASNFASAILMEAGLSFLGIGAQPPVPSWGEMINAHRGYILMDKAYLAFVPGLAIMLLVLSFMMVGNGLRDALDTRTNDQSPIV